MWVILSVAFHGLVLKCNFMLERRACSYKGRAAVVNTMYSITFSSAFLQSYCHSCGFSLNPPVFQYPLGIMDARTGYAFPSVITSVSDAELMMCLRGQKKGAFQQLPHGPCCAAEGSRTTLAPPSLLFLLVTPIHPFHYIQYFPLDIQGYHSPFITVLGI